MKSFLKRMGTICSFLKQFVHLLLRLNRKSISFGLRSQEIETNEIIRQEGLHNSFHIFFIVMHLMTVALKTNLYFDCFCIQLHWIYPILVNTAFKLMEHKMIIPVKVN